MAPARTLALAYFALALTGLVLPYAAFLPWLGAHGPDGPALVAELFSTRIGSFFGLDVIVSAIVLLLFVAGEGQGVPARWLPVVATLLIGVSCGLPLFLGLRQWRRA